MPLKLDYKDKYNLWTDLVRGSADRLFIRTDEALPLASGASIEVSVPELKLPIVVLGRVVGRRKRSNRFAPGVYVRIGATELEKCRRFLKLRPADEADARARRATRVPFETEVRFLKPEQAKPAISRNLSQMGLLVSGAGDLAPGQLVRIVVDLEGAPLEVEASVAWIAGSREDVGLEFADLGEADAERVSDVVSRLTEQDGASSRQRSILVADDDPEVLLLITKMLSEHGYDVHQATSGDETIANIRKLNPSLVLMDVLLPGVDGAHICKTMRSDAEMMDIPVILVSALERDALHRVADESGATDYLEKPFEFTALIDLVGSYLRR